MPQHFKKVHFISGFFLPQRLNIGNVDCRVCYKENEIATQLMGLEIV